MLRCCLLWWQGYRTAENQVIKKIIINSLQEPECATETALPGLASPAHLKVMNVPFGSTPSSHVAPPPAQRRRQLEARTAHLQQLQALHERR